MFGEKNRRWGIVICLVFMLACAAAAPAGPTNGDFSAGLSGWNTSGIVIWLGPTDFYPESVGLFPDSDEVIGHSSLSQPFILDAGSRTLSFDLVMETPGGGETDTFTASLLNPDTNDPLISVSGQTYFFSQNSRGDIDDSLVTVSAGTISIDVSGLAGQDVLLVLDLQHEYCDDVDTSVYLDNVRVATVPAPGALLLCGLGSALVVCWRNRSGSRRSTRRGDCV